MNKILKALNVVQEVSNEDRNRRGLDSLGRGYLKAYRFNLYNPLSYIFLTIIFAYAFLLHGLSAFKNFVNPFKWN